jgi:toxin secretion/phage lysis holin
MAKWIVGAAGCLLVACFGPPFPQIFTLLLMLMLLDLVAAVIVNGKAGKLDPVVGYAGWKRKAMTVLVVLAVPIVKHVAAQSGLPGLDDIPAATAVAGGFALLELLSILKHAALLGVELPISIQTSFKPPPPKDDKDEGDPPIVPHG